LRAPFSVIDGTGFAVSRVPRGYSPLCTLYGSNNVAIDLPVGRI
jgi:hypothetical protein